MNQSTVKKNKSQPLKTFILAILIAMLIVVVAWHVLLPLLGLTIVVSATMWSIAVGTIFLICASILLFFIFTGVGIFIVGIIALIWTLLAIILFPLLFPILIPLLILMLVLGLLRKNRNI